MIVPQAPEFRQMDTPRSSMLWNEPKVGLSVNPFSGLVYVFGIIVSHMGFVLKDICSFLAGLRVSARRAWLGFNTC